MENPISPHHIHHNILSDLMTARDPRDGISRTKTSHLLPEMSGVPQKGAMRSRRQGTHLLARDRVRVPAITTAALLDISSQTRARLTGATGGGKAFQSHTHFTQKPEQSPDQSATFNRVFENGKGSVASDPRGRAKCQNPSITVLAEGNEVQVRTKGSSLLLLFTIIGQRPRENKRSEKRVTL